MPEATVSFTTVGCRLNQADTARLRAAFAEAGYRVVQRPRPGGVCVVQGCTVTARAHQDTLRLARRAQRAGAFVVVAGCPAEVDPAGVQAACGARLVVGQAGRERLPERLAEYGFPAPPARSAPLVPRFETRRAIVKVQDGCDFQCRYCIVPRARGPARSRPLEAVVAEIRALADRGYLEIVLTGANLGSYDDGGRSLLDLLRRLESVPGLARVRLSSIEVSTVERDILAFMADSAILCRSLHLPLQSGSPAVLRAMGRRYSVSDYGAVVEYALSRVGRIGLGTDVIAGFPGETDADARATERALAAWPFSLVHVFCYSPRPGTPAAELPDAVPAPEARLRAARLAGLARRQREAFARSWIGRPADVLVESVDALGRGRGWTGEYLPARLDPPPPGRSSAPPLTPNRLVRVVPRSVAGDLLIGGFSA